MKNILLWGSYLGLILGIIACIGLCLIAVFPDNEDLPLYKNINWGKIHDTIATIAILSFFLDIVWYGIMVIIDKQTTQYMPSNTLFIPFFLSMFLIAVFGITQLIWSKKCKNDTTLEVFPGEGIYSFPLWEWILFFLLFLNLYWVVFSLPL